MKKKSGILLTLALLFGTLGILNLSNSYEEKKECDTVAIVTLKDKTDYDSETRKNIFNNFKNELVSTVGFNYKIVNNLTNIGNYVILKVNSNDVSKIKSLSTVSNVGLNHHYETTSNDVGVEADDTSGKDVKPVNYSIEQMKVNSSSTRGEKTLIAVLDNFFQLDHETFKDLSSSKVKFSKNEIVNITSEKTLTAKGTTYYNNKIPFYYDYADKDNEVLAKSATADNTHGIHVASMAAANGDKFEGIAPNAQLALMKISSDSNIGSSSDATILLALNDAVAIGADVINLSFGSPIDTYENIRDEELKSDNSTIFGAIKNLTEQGIVMSISAGNEGRGQYIKDNSQTNDYGDYCNFSLDNVEPGIIGSFAESQYGSIVASGRLEAQYDPEVNKCAEYTKKVSGFSSEGTTYDLHIGVDVITPGENVWGAVYYKEGTDDARYAQKDGTSMAAPNYSGVVSAVLSDLIKDDASNRESYAKTLTQRIQSTAEPLVQFNNAYYSPRKQGAGQPNVEKAINSDVYLSSTNTKAKIELFNNEDVAKGHLKFDVDTHNLSTKDKKYKLTLSVQCPGFAGDNEQYASLMDQLIDSYTTEITIQSGDSSFSVDYNISNDAKKILDKFPNGTCLEGYVVLEPVDSSDIELSIPYLGFYGDYNEASAVEEFDFEKGDNEVTGSTLLNSLYKAKGRANVDFTSTIVTSSSSIAGYLSKIVSGNDNVFNYGTKILVDDDKLVGGIKNLSDYIIIQQIVYRNIKDNNVRLIDENGEVVYSTKLYNYNETDEYNTTDGSLRKSLVLNETSGINSSKAIGEIEIRNSKGELNYKAGSYTLEFDYELVYGVHQTRRYDFVIKDEVASNPVVGTKENKNDKIRINLEENTESVSINGDKYDVLKDGDQKYIEFETSKYSSRGKILLEITNEFGLTTSQLFNLNDLENGFSVESSLLKVTYTPSLTMEVGEVDENNRFKVSYKTLIKNSRGNAVNEIQTYRVNVKVPSNANVTPTEEKTLNDLITVQEIGIDKTIKDIEFTVHDGYLSYTTRSGNVVVTYTKAEDGKLNPIVFVFIGIGVLVVIGVAVVVVICVRKKKENATKSK